MPGKESYQTGGVGVVECWRQRFGSGKNKEGSGEVRVKTRTC